MQTTTDMQSVDLKKAGDQKNSTGHAVNGHLSNVSPPGEYDEDDWAEWSTWSPCSRTCGRGVSTRTRHCSNAASA